MSLLIAAIAVLVFMWLVAPALGHPLVEPRTKGLSALQTLFTLAGITLVVTWYVVEQPDAARLRFDQSVMALPAPNGQALVIIEVSIENVGGHEARFDDAAYKILIERVSPLDPAIAAHDVQLGPDGYRVVQNASNWTSPGPNQTVSGLLAYRLAGKDEDGWKKTHEGLRSTIAPEETEHLYYRAIIPCVDDLTISVESRYKTLPGPMSMFGRDSNLVWVKQSFLELNEACKREEPK